ncbi:hypothetical protein [Bacteroides sp. An51A]|uniref:hypothetical protein n=1 Tax=Bacteroides sp. An51A TaxID=1965640 RepID=UPI001177592D|nr:hypothetical protein [Bacteroides sp. An51A]
MKTIQNVLIGISLLFCGGLMSCTDDTETTDVQQSVKPGLYSLDITLIAESGVKSETRGLDTENGEFTNEYPYDYIYIHSAKTDNTHQSIRIPLENVEHCDGCQGIHMQVEDEDEENGGGYIIRAGEAEMTLSADDNVYFSTIEGPYWEAETSGATPVSGSDVFVQNDEINKELLKSQTYTKDELVNLMQQDIPTITMTRHVTGFRVYFMFTQVTADGSTDNDIDEDDWISELGCNPSDFSIKLYLGPNFCHQYDVLNNAVVSGDEGGFYATNDQTYQEFERVEYSYTTGDNGIGLYRGFGYVTDASNYLLSPLNTSIPATDFSIYAFIKYKSSDYSSDEGASWFQAQIPGITLETNRIHYIIMAFDIEDLRSQFLPATTTLSRTPWSAPRKIGIKPIKVICN